MQGESSEFDKLNIEGMAIHDDTGHLLLGLRDPLAAGSSVIVTIENTAGMFDEGAAPVFGEAVLLDIGGGIRALSFDPVLETFLLVNEVEGADGKNVSQLWTWSGSSEAEPLPLTLPGIINLDNVESIDSVTIGDEPRLIIMSDDGNAKKGRPAKYLLLDYDQLTM